MTKKKSPIMRDQMLGKVLQNVTHLEREGVKIDGNLVALAYWIADPGNGNLEARIKHGSDDQDRPASPSCLGLVYEQLKSFYGGDTTWDKEGSDASRRLDHLDNRTFRAGICVRVVDVDPKNLGGFLKESGLPKLDWEQLRAVLNGVEATDVSSERVEIAKTICGPEAGWGDLSGRPLNNEEYAKVLVHHCSPELRERLLRAPDNIRVTVLQQAIYGRRNDWLCEMLDQGLSTDACDRIYGRRLLHIAASVDADATEMLLARGADVHIKDGMGCTPLHYALDNVESCRALLEGGAQIDAMDDLWFVPLHGMLERSPDELEKRLAVINLMIDRGADPFYVPEKAPINYLTPFQYAVKAGSIEQVGVILRRFDVDLGQKTLSDRTLAQLAGKNKQMKDFLRSSKTEHAVRGAINATRGEDKPAARKNGGMAPL